MHAVVFVDNHDNQRGHGGAGGVMTACGPGHNDWQYKVVACTVLLYCCTVLLYNAAGLYCCTVQLYCTAVLCCCTVLLCCTAVLYCCAAFSESYQHSRNPSADETDMPEVEKEDTEGYRLIFWAN